ncbi:unnamed protein product [Dovyalis caffra]|uniref:ADP-ribosyl cyclase/cyclic ADP-ribose hydrolase n=1 Tax=Dovyalis caffra TaxID=77055 RepID=A0AAV1QSQ0_9ROSI|nr:unnamed protein product [Dovyalis caffra]
MGPLSFRHSFTRDRLHRKRVLIALDDVDNLMQLQEWKELILKHQSSFGPGSKILVTSRDKQLLREMVGEECIYEVKGLNLEEAFQLFSMKAFNSRNPTIDHENLLGRTIAFAQGNPLGLIVLGSALFGKSNEEWHSALNKLALNPQIENVLRISYDGLDYEQQSIFLDIAYFYIGWERKHATRVLESCYPSALYNISTLIDKYLITSSYNTLQIHHLLQEMALSIVRAESKNPGERSRLCDPDDVVHVLKKKKESDRIEGISLDTSKLSREMHLESDAFAKMDCLRFLKFYGHRRLTRIHLPSSGLKYLSDELRYLCWDGFPCKSLPQNFCAENLFELEFWRSKVEKLWKGEQDLVNLRRIQLRECECLTELPDLSKAKNLKVLNLVGCNSLIEVPPSLQCLEELEVLDVDGCCNVRSLPSRFDSKKLRAFTMTKCLGLSKCPEIISRNMKKLKLSGTSVREVAGSITSTLEQLYLTGCSNISKFPEGLRDIIDLGLSRTAIEEVPSSIQFLTRLKILGLRGCSKLESFPDTTEPIKSLRRLDLAKTGIKQLPSSIKYLISLEYLNIEGTPIREPPEVPPSLMFLIARDCASLETISTVNLRSGGIHWRFSNCFKLDQKALSADMHLKLQSAKIKNMTMILTGSEIPEWFSGQGVGSSVTIQFPSNCQQLKGFAFSIAFLFPSNCQQLKSEVSTELCCRVKTKNGEHEGFICVSIQDRTPFYSDHMLLQYEAAVSENQFSKFFGKENVFGKYSGNEVTFEFHPFNMLCTKGEIEKLCKVKRCGVYLHFDENLPSKKYSDE